jgi:hypothetical protein
VRHSMRYKDKRFGSSRRKCLTRRAGKMTATIGGLLLAVILVGVVVLLVLVTKVEVAGEIQRN